MFCLSYSTCTNNISCFNEVKFCPPFIDHSNKAILNQKLMYSIIGGVFIYTSAIIYRSTPYFGDGAKLFKTMMSCSATITVFIIVL